MTLELTDIIRMRDRERWWEIHDPDEYICPDCGRTNGHPEFKRWEVHHIDRQPGKIVALCRKSHWVRHGAKPSTVSVEWWKDAVLALGNS